MCLLLLAFVCDAASGQCGRSRCKHRRLSRRSVVCNPCCPPSVKSCYVLPLVPKICVTRMIAAAPSGWCLWEANICPAGPLTNVYADCSSIVAPNCSCTTPMASNGRTPLPIEDPDFYSNKIDRAPGPLTMAEADSITPGPGQTISRISGYFRIIRSSVDTRIFVLYSSTSASGVIHYFGIPISDYSGQVPLTDIAPSNVTPMAKTVGAVVREIIVKHDAKYFHIHLCQQTW